MARPNKGQHTIPRTYLEAFTDPQGLLWVADRSFKVFSRKPDQILTEKDYYTIKFPSGGGTLAIETKFLNGIEGTYTTIFRDKISKKQPLILEEKAKMAVFVASMMERQSKSREGLKRFFKDSEEKIKHLMTLSESAKKRVASMMLFNKNESSISADELLKMGNDVGSLHSSLIPNTVADIAPIIFNMKWIFMLRPKEADPFITSNNPTVMIDPVAENKIGRGKWGSLPGLSYNDIELTLPLSSSITLMIGWQAKYDCTYAEIPIELVNEVNRRTRRHAKIILASDKQMIERIAKRTKIHHNNL